MKRAGRFTRARALLAALALAPLLAACAHGSTHPQSPLDPQGPVAKTEHNLFVPVFWIAAFVFVLVEGLIVYIVLRFRARQADEAPVQTHGNFRLELTWTIIPAVLLGVIGIFTIKTVFDVNRIPKGPEVVQVKITGHRWWWEYSYPGLNVTTANVLAIPINKKVVLSMTSADVIHSFWPPKLAGKVDVVPGQINQMVIEAVKPDTYYGQCAEYCGTSHANMRLQVEAMTQSDFDTWVRQQQAGPAVVATTTTSTDPAVQGANLFMTKGCSGCHTVNGVSAGAVGPNLTHLQSRDCFAGCLFDMNDQNLRRWLRNPPAEKPGSVMPNLNLSETEITNLIAYLDSLK
jgi:cytochrome c oxidase subunit II